MKHMEFAAAFGEQRKTVQITEPNGAGGPLQILIDNWYHGIMIKKDGKWIGYLNDKSDLTAEDITIIGERVDEVLYPTDYFW